MRSLSRDEAVRRAAAVRVGTYRIALDVTGEDSFDSVTTIDFEYTGQDASTFLEVDPVQVREVRLNGELLDVDAAFSPAQGRLTLTNLQPHNVLVVAVTMVYSHDGDGLHRHVDPSDGLVYLYANSSITAGPRWFACFDQPDLKASVQLSIACPSQWSVAGNGPATQTAPGRWECAPTPPMSTYLVAFVAGRYHQVSGEHDGIPLMLHAPASLAAQLDRQGPELIEFTGACFAEFHQLFGIRYPWGEYHQAFVPGLNWGAMENPGCVTIRDSLLFRSRVTDSDLLSRATTIAHEMAHMWFGNLVTMRWWDDLWLNESFAEYLGHRVASAVTGRSAWVGFGVTRKSWGYYADRRPSTHPVAGNGVADAGQALAGVDGITYAKGAAVLRQLAENLGDDAFFGGLRTYFQRYSWGNAEFADLIEVWTAAGDLDVASWAQAWLRTSGVDTLQVSDTDSSVHLLRLPGAGGQVRSHQLTVAGYDHGATELGTSRIRVTEAVTPLPGFPAESALVLPDSTDATWAKSALTAAHWQAMPSLLPGLPDLARVSVWTALRLAVADAEVAPALAVDIATAGLADEEDDAILAAGAAWLTDIVLATYVGSDHDREDGERRLAAALAAVLDRAPQGSGRQLAAVRAWIDASEPAPLAAWLAGMLPHHIELDAELRWRVLRRLTALGELSSERIEEEAAADHSSQGAVHAASCRALLPTATAKASAWALIMTDPDAHNHQLYATAGAFWHPRHSELTEPYVERYFAEIATTARVRDGWVLEITARHGFPHTARQTSALDAARTLIDSPDVDAGIRRAVVDGTDDLRRALAARTTFG